MSAKRFKLRYGAGFTLVEIMVTIVILVIAVLGTSAFRYSAALNVRQAEAKTTAVRIAQMLCESWRGTSEPNTFDPEIALDLEESFGSEYAAIFAIDDTEDGPVVTEGFTLSGHYEIEIGDPNSGAAISYWATLSWRDVSPGLRALNVVVEWDPRSSVTDYYWHSAHQRSFKLTTYVTN